MDIDLSITAENLETYDKGWEDVTIAEYVDIDDLAKCYIKVPDDGQKRVALTREELIKACLKHETAWQFEEKIADEIFGKET